MLAQPGLLKLLKHQGPSALKLYHVFTQLLRTAFPTEVTFRYTGSEAELSGAPDNLLQLEKQLSVFNSIRAHSKTLRSESMG